MSAGATGWVWDYSPFRGATFSCHLAIADTVNDQHGWEFWMSVGNLARKARCSRDAARKALRRLEGCDEHGDPIDGAPVLIEVIEERLGETTRYRFLQPDLPRVLGAPPGRVSDATPPRPRRGVPRVPGATPSRLGRDQQEKNAKDEPEADPARRVARAVWEARTPRPAAGFLAVLNVASRLLDAGNDADAVTAAMTAAPVLTIAAVELQLHRAGRGGARVVPLRPVDTDRAAASGRLDL